MALLTASLKFGLGLWAWAQARSTSRLGTSKCLKEKEPFCDIYYYALGNFSVKTKDKNILPVWKSLNVQKKNNFAC